MKMIDKKRTACFTGHRNIPEKDVQRIEELLDRVIEALYRKGVVYFGAGGAYGFDMLAEKAVLRARERHGEIKLILVLPCKEQDKYWTAENRRLFSEIMSRADKVCYTAESYYDGCMLKRDRHLVDFSGYCVAYLAKSSGGTAYTVKYAAQNGLGIINLAELMKT